MNLTSRVVTFRAYFTLIVFLFFLSCKQTNTDSTSTERVLDDTITSKQILNTSKYDLTEYSRDTFFLNEGVKYIIWRFNENQSDDTDYRDFVVERISENKSDTILTFAASDVFEYGLGDIDNDGNTDIIVQNDPMRMFRYYLFDATAKKFIDNMYLYGGWKSIKKQLVFNFPEELKGPNFSSNLFKSENGKFITLGYVSVSASEEEGAEDWENSFFPIAPKVTLNKVYRTNPNKKEWEEEIDSALVSQYLYKDKGNYKELFNIIWSKNYQRF